MNNQPIYPTVKKIAHHATLISRCDEHGDHVVRLTSDDDFCWLLAEWARQYLEENGYEARVHKRRVRVYEGGEQTGEGMPF